MDSLLIPLLVAGTILGGMIILAIVIFKSDDDYDT